MAEYHHQKTSDVSYAASLKFDEERNAEVSCCVVAIVERNWLYMAESYLFGQWTS